MKYLYFMEMGTRGHVIKHGKQSGNAESLELFVFGCLRAPETEGFFVLRAIRIFLSVTTKQQDIRKKETKMNSLVIILIAMAVLVAGYVFYGRWLAKKWGIDEKAKTPAFTHEDGEDFVPSSKFTVFSHQFSLYRRGRPCDGSHPRIGIRMGACASVASDRRLVLRCGAGLRCPVCLCEERRKIHGNDH